MASSPEQQLPIFYKSLVPLQSTVHADFGLVQRATVPFAAGTHAIPITVDEFPIAQRHYPIVFGVGESPAPLALVGLTDGQNLYVDGEGNWQTGTYIPAFVRRYPFMLAKLTPADENLSLCFDNTSDLLTEASDNKLFAAGESTETTKNILTFCEQFEQAIARTRGFVDELMKLELLMEGEVKIEQPGMAQPATYRGFQMVSEEKFQNLRGDQARRMVQSGMMGLIYAHLFSLSQISGLFEKQQAAG